LLNLISEIIHEKLISNPIFYSNSLPPGGSRLRCVVR